MIAKHVPMRSPKKSDFRKLIKYLKNPQTKQERVGRVAVTNCLQDDALDAALEIQATQALNTRAEADKTYHLIISFREGESPASEILEAIEARVCASLGYVDHQRISAVHHDTDNLHIHVVINKIHPTRHTIHTPYNDYKTLGEVCEKLELEYGLEADNHTARKTGSENRAGDMERHAGVESLLGWIKRGCAKQMTSARSWTELHEVMLRNGLELRERGNGLIITDGAGVGVKASSVARELSKGKLEGRFGAFEAATVRVASPAIVEMRRLQAPPVEKVGRNPPPCSRGRLRNLSDLQVMQIDSGCHYDQQPIFTKKINTVELYAKYNVEQQELGVARSNAIAQARAKKERLIEAAKRTGRLKRAVIKMLKGPGVNKKLLYAFTSKALREDIDRINANYLKDRDAAYMVHHRRAWADWLKVKATQGSREALAALRARETRQRWSSNTVGGQIACRTGPIPGLKPDSITKAGTTIYRVGSTAIRDDGELIKVSRGAGEHGLEAAIRMAVYRYGERITVNGSAEFKELIAQVAAVEKLSVIFDDPALELRRQHLVDTAATRAKLTKVAAPGTHIEFTQAQARDAGAFHEDALSELDAAQSCLQTPNLADTAATRAKLVEATAPGTHIEFTQAQARDAGAFHEDALSELDAAQSRPQTPTKKEQGHEQQAQTQQSVYDRGQRDRRGDGATATVSSSVRAGRAGSVSREIRSPAERGKSNIGNNGRQPPPWNRNCLHNLSQLRVVQIDQGSDVLLPSDVSRHLEQQGAQRDKGLRWDIHRVEGEGEGVVASVSAVTDKHISERKTESVKKFGITNKSRYNVSNKGTGKTKVKSR